MSPAITSALQAELRHVASSASAPLMEFLDRCEHAPAAESERFRELAIVVGHEAKAIARIGQRPAHDHAHGVIQVTAAHLLFQADGQGLFGELGHGCGSRG